MILYYLMLFLAPFMEYPHLPKIGTFTVIKAVGILTMAIAAVKAGAASRPLLLFRWAESRLFVALLSMVVVSAVWVGLVPSAVAAVQTYLSFLIFLFTTLVMVDSLEKLKKSCFVVLVSMFIASLYIYNGYIRWGENRPGGIVGDPNYYAMIAITILPMALLLQANSRGLTRLFFIATAVSLAASTFLGGSRAGLLGICLSAGYLIQYMRQRLLVFSIGALTMTILLLALPTSPLQRLLNPSKEAVTSSSLRTRILKAGMEMIRDHPVTGVGIAQFKATSVQYTPELTVTASGRRSRYDGHIAHNTYLNVAAELGIFGIGIFLAILVSSWRRARKLARWAAQQTPTPVTAIQIARAIEAGLVGYAFTAIFLTADYIKHAWILMFFGMALNRIMLFQYPPSMRREPAGIPVVNRIRPGRYSAPIVRTPVPRRGMETAI
jgi:O-antigen ligase